MPGMYSIESCDRNQSFFVGEKNSTPAVAWPRPIPVSERLPEVGKPVLWCSGGEWECGHLTDSDLDGKKWWSPDTHYDIVPLDTTATHWLPLPPSPTE